MRNALKISLAYMAVGAIMACSGGGAPQPSNNATKLAYTDSASGDYRLEIAGGAGTGTMALALRGPSSVTARGVNFGLSLDQSKARFVAQEGSDFARPGAVFDLGQSPRIFKAALDGGSLRVSMAQKGDAVPAKPLGGDIATVTVQMQPGAQKGPVALSTLDAKVLLENGSVQTVQVQVGKLEAE
jgi:hypothetical protein